MATTPEQSESATNRALEIGARLTNGPSQLLIETAFRQELEHQLPLFDTLSQVDLAHSLVLIENGIMPKAAGLALLQSLLQLKNQPSDFSPDPANGDLYTNREVWLMNKTPAAAWLGAGRARREAITTAFTIKVRETLLALTETLTDFAASLLSKAEQHQTSLMPDYTYLQAAQPTSFGHYLLGFAYPVLRDIQRIQQTYLRLNLSPSGCGSSNGSRLPQSRSRLAELLGFDGLVTHARDAMWQADLMIEIAAVATAIMVNLDRLAEDLQIFATEEFGLLELDDAHARASKIMPQKKNPFALTHIRGLANSMIGTLVGSAALGRTPSGQPDNRLALYGLMPKALADTHNAVALMNEVVALMQFNTQHARAKLYHGFVMATDLAEALVLKTGLPFRDAHRLVGQLVRRHLSDGKLRTLTPKELADGAAELLGQRIDLSAEQLEQALQPEAALEARRETGGAALAAMSEMISQCRQDLIQADTWLRERQQRLTQADMLLERSIQYVLDAASAR